ncbi:PilZ domain-containing protein [Halioglobus maricola]|uniref:PilZ domain-containing protein n=1 Tax=Halioglobus maricola TaxID=2601894 RepID=A0A5P9NM76_9GAMM|nr:PilZ domain-containing protein [Halioglobus maricola]QFU76973.1 PilZ domain-containing protein [Halioglobus maricola]
MSWTERKHQRLPIESRVFIELVAAPAGSGEDAQIAICKTMNVSSHGLMVALEQELPVEAFLQIGVEPPRDTGSEAFYMLGQVRWCKPSDDPEFPWLAGFALQQAEHSDISSWIKLITALEPGS